VFQAAAPISKEEAPESWNSDKNAPMGLYELLAFFQDIHGIQDMLKRVIQNNYICLLRLLKRILDKPKFHLNAASARRLHTVAVRVITAYGRAAL
jgi:hypothetical protein